MNYRNSIWTGVCCLRDGTGWHRFSKRLMELSDTSQLVVFSRRIFSHCMVEVIDKLDWIEKTITRFKQQ